MTAIPVELIDRMVSLVRDLHADHLKYDLHDRQQDFCQRTAAIVAELPKPEPVDPDVLVVRAILHAHQRAMTTPDSGWGNMSYASGSYDTLPTFRAALAAYKELRTAAPLVGERS